MTHNHSTAPWKYNKRTNEIVSGKSRKRIAKIETQGMGYEVEPNAKLIQHAPDLLDSLEGLMRFVSTKGEPFLARHDAIEKAKKTILKASNEIFWTYEVDDEIFDGEFDTRDEADEYAQEQYAESLDEPMKNGDVFTNDCYALIEFTYDDEGERVIYTREDAVLEYEHYHGDLKEHGYPY